MSNDARKIINAINSLKQQQAWQFEQEEARRQGYRKLSSLDLEALRAGKLASGGQDGSPVMAEGASRDDLQFPKNLFRRNGDVWEVRFNGKPDRPCAVLNRKGMGHIAKALRHQGESIPPRDYITSTRATSSPHSARESQWSDNDEAGDLAAPANQVDQQTINSCRRKLESLQAKRAAAEKNNDLAKLSRIDEVSAKIEQYLQNAVGPGGRIRPFDNEDVKARKAVRGAILDAYKKFPPELEALRKHLESNVKITATAVTYDPTPRINWTF